MSTDIATKRKKPRHSAGLPAAPEVRHFAATGLEVRAASDGSGDLVEITGAPIVYNAPYSVRDMFGEFNETMMPGVASQVLATGNADCRFLFNHDGLPLARTMSGTLSLRDTEDALTFTAGLDMRQGLANDLVIAIERGDVSQMSCGFVVAADTWNDDYTERSIFSFRDLLDVSAVTYPASPTTSIDLAQRSWLGMPAESRNRVRKVWAISKDLREGKVLSAANAELLQSALEALHRADDVDIPGIVHSLQEIDSALDTGQAAVSAVLDVANPNDDEQTDDALGVDGDTIGEPDVNTSRADTIEAETRDAESADEAEVEDIDDEEVVESDSEGIIEVEEPAQRSAAVALSLELERMSLLTA